MRISDWSSDVCSSDLEQRRALRRPVARRSGAVPFAGDKDERFARVRIAPRGLPQRQNVAARRVDRASRRDRFVQQVADIGVGEQPAQNQDRKSVVSGTSMSVRVDLGGRRIIKKKIYNKRNNTLNNTATRIY